VHSGPEYPGYALAAAHSAPEGRQLSDYAGLVLRRLKRQGQACHGEGRRGEYRPWIHIRRRLSTRTSHQILAHLPLRRRSFHFLSKIELAAGLVAAWLGAEEIRECLPIWPVDHRSPAAGWDPATDLQVGQVQGLLDIASAAGIDHGVYPGTAIPYIASADLVCVLPPSAATRLLFIGCKPSRALIAGGRVLERLELERLYAVTCGGVHRIVHEHTFPRQLVENLQWILPRFSELERLKGSALIRDFAGEFLNRADMPVTQARNEAASRVSSGEDAEALFRMCLWLRLIDADLTQPLLRTRPLPRDGGRLAATERALLLE
jgi:hypothetical protein